MSETRTVAPGYRLRCCPECEGQGDVYEVDGAWVAQQRAKKGESLRQVADSLCLSHSLIAQIERGEKRPGARVARMLVNYFYDASTRPTARKARQ